MATAGFKSGSVVESFTSTPTSGSTLTLVATSDAYQVFTGTNIHTVVMPDATTMIQNQRFEIVNTSTGAITVNANGGGNLGTVLTGATRVFRATSILTSAGTWDITTIAAAAAGLSPAESGQFGALAAGGFSAQSRVLKINPEEVAGNYWTNSSSVSSIRRNVGTLALNGFLYAIGGDNNNSPYYSDNFRYSDDSNFWLAKTSEGTAKSNAATFTLNGKNYIIGGFNGSELSTGQSYNDATDVWANTASAPVTFRSSCGGLAYDYGYITAGLSGGTASTINYAYNDTNNAYYTRSSLPAVRSDAGAFNTPGDASFYVFAGNNVSSRQSTVYKFTSVTNSWYTSPNPYPSSMAGGAGASAVGLGFGLSGFIGSNASTICYGYKFDTDYWYSISSINTGVYDSCQAASSLNGQAYMIGGSTTSPLTNAVQQYTPFSLFSIGSLKKSTTAPASIAVAVVLNALTPNVPVQVRTDGSNWKTFMSAGSVLKLNEIITAKFNKSLMPYWMGGTPDNATAQSTMQFYEDFSNTWTSRQSASATRWLHGSFSVDGRGYVFEGQGTSAANRHSSEKYDELLNTWVTASTTPATYTPIGCHGYELEGFGYSVGGSTGTANFNSGITDHYRYNSTLDSWVIRAVLTAARAGGYAGSHNGFGFIAAGHAIGGTNQSTNFRYFPATDTWSTAGALTSARAEGCGGATLNGFGYAVGGSGGPANAEKFNSGTNTWSNTGATSVNHGAASTVAPSANGFVYAAGNGFASATSEKYNDASNLWSSIASPSTNLAYGSSGASAGSYRNYELRVGIPAFYAGVGGGVWTLGVNLTTNHNSGGEFSLGGYGYMVNGFIGAGSQTAQMDRYNESIDVWTQSVSNSNALYSVPTFVLEGRGHRPTGQTSNGPHEAFSPELSAWATLASGPGVADYAQGSTLDGRGYLLGASGPSTAQYYRNSTNSWTTVTSPGSGLQSARWSQNGFIYAAGSDATSTSVQKYNDVADSWSTAGSMVVARRNHAVLFGGKGLMASSYSSLTTSTEQYNDASNTWALTASLSVGTGSQAVFSLSNAYSAGGYNGSGVMTNQRFTNSVKQAVLSAGLTVS